MTIRDYEKQIEQCNQQAYECILLMHKARTQQEKEHWLDYADEFRNLRIQWEQQAKEREVYLV